MIHFERGKDPRGTMGIGLAAQIKKAVEKIVGNPSFIFIPDENREKWEAQISEEIGVKVDLDILYDDGGIYKLRVKCEKANYQEDFDIGGSMIWGTTTKVAAKTMGQDIVSVKPMSAPTGHTSYFDYQYGKSKKGKKKKGIK